MSEALFNVNSMIKKLKEILKCDICHNIFDFNEHLPMIARTGETFCKKCLSDEKINLKVENKLKINVHEDNLFMNKFVENLKLEIIIKEILSIYDKTIKEKLVVFSKNLTERNSNNQRYGHYLLTYNNNNNNNTGLKESNSNEYIYNNSNKKINHKSKNSLNVSKNGNNKNNNNSPIIKNDKTEINKNDKENKENHYKIISKDIVFKSTMNKNNSKNSSKNIKSNEINLSDIDNNLNTLDFNEEINNIYDKDKSLFESNNNEIKKICDDSIETIPIYDEKNNPNMSFRNEFNELWLKNDELQGGKKCKKEYKNELNKYVFVNKNNLIYKNNQKTASTVNIKKKNSKDENIISYQLSEPNLDNLNISKTKINNNLNNIDNTKNNNDKTKEEEKSGNTKIDGNEIKRIYKNLNYYDLENKPILKSMTKFENSNKPKIESTKYKKIKNYNKLNINKYRQTQATPTQIISRESNRKIEEDDIEDNLKFKNLTTFKINNECNNNKYEEDKNVLFDEDEIKIIVKKMNNAYINEEERKLLSNKNSGQLKYNCKNNKINNNITYNKKILGKSSLSPFKNISQDISPDKNGYINKNESLNRIKCYKNSTNRFRTISQAKTNENFTEDNQSTNEILRSSVTRKNAQSPIINSSNKNNNVNNITRIPKITSIYLKIDNPKHNNNKSDISNNRNIDFSNINNENISKNESDLKYSVDDQIIPKAKTFMHKTKDELDNIYKGNNLKLSNRNKNNMFFSKNKYLETKNKEFNFLFDERINNEQNLNIKNILLNNKSKYLEIIKNSVNCSLFNDLLCEVQILLLQNGDFYIGILSPENNLPQKGILLSIEGNYYEGMFLDGKKDGKGLILYKNGAKYEGEIKNNLHNGFGKLTQLDGEIFIGQWKNGKINGKGVRYHSNGDVYSGDYVNSIRDGIGKYVFFNGDSYEGQWKNGKANGKGFFKFKNGNVYEGYFENNSFCGQGCFKKKTGEIYIGEFKNGLLNGEGTEINQDKEKFVGIFINGKKSGNGILYDKNGNIIKSGVWESNEFVSDFTN